MKCPVCEKEQLKSYVYPGTGSTTLLGHRPYYDEDGNYHYHDPNTTTVRYNCSNGHAWREQSKRRCPSCDYGGEPTIIIDKQNETS